VPVYTCDNVSRVISLAPNIHLRPNVRMVEESINNAIAPPPAEDFFAPLNQSFQHEVEMKEECESRPNEISVQTEDDDVSQGAMSNLTIEDTVPEVDPYVQDDLLTEEQFNEDIGHRNAKLTESIEHTEIMISCPVFTAETKQQLRKARNELKRGM